MFGDLMGNMQEKQEQLQNKLKETIINYSEDGYEIELNALKQIRNIDFPSQLASEERKEELVDMLINHLNRAMVMADEKANTESSSLLNDMLPGGLGGLFGS
jgi:DNA-binding protein YbaB